MTANVRRLSRMASAATPRSERIRVRSLASMATSTSSMPTWAATARAAARLPPPSRIGCRPRERSEARPAALPGLTMSASTILPTHRSSRWTVTTVHPVASAFDLATATMRIFFDQPTETANLDFDAAQPSKQQLLVVGVAGAFIRASVVPPRGMNPPSVRAGR